MKVQQKDIAKALVAILGGILYVIGVLGILVATFMLYEGRLLEVGNTSLAKFGSIIMAYPVAIACFWYVSEMRSKMHMLAFASIFPFAAIAIYALFVVALESIGVNKGKDSIFIAAIPTVTVSLLLARFIYGKLCQKYA